jgi:iron-sulfur cluster assembly accessory protein
MTTTVEQTQVVTLTPKAAENVTSLLADKKLEGHCLRVYVAGIGCSGPQYGLAFDENPRENDTVIETDGVKMIIDANSLVYLEGATVDFVETPQGAGFKIENPNPMATSACGTCSGSCG